MNTSITHVALVLATLAVTPVHAAHISGFEGLASGPNTFHTGTARPFPGGDTTFQSGFATYGHNAVDWGGFTSWDGFAWSNVVDTTTPGFTNQYASYAGGGTRGTATYVVAYLPAQGGGGRTQTRSIGFDVLSLLDGAWFTNTTYAARSMLAGDSFTKAFSLADDDFLDLTIEGLANGAVTTSLTVALADYRGATPVLLDAWTFVDLASLGWVDGLRFQLNGSDFGAFGLNTPAYFAMDELTRQAAVPLPGAVWGFVAAVGLLGRRVRAGRRVPCSPGTPA